MWTALDAHCHDPSTKDDYNCARDGSSSCSVTVFGAADQTLDRRIKFEDHKGRQDSCGDIDDQGTFSFAPRDLVVPCEGQ